MKCRVVYIMSINIGLLFPQGKGLIYQQKPAQKLGLALLFNYIYMTHQTFSFPSKNHKNSSKIKHPGEYLT